MIRQDAIKPSIKISLFAGSMTIIGGLFYMIYKSKTSQNSLEFDLPRDTVMKIIREFRREFYILFRNISVHSQRYQEDLKMGPPLTQTRLHQILFSQYTNPASGIPDQIKDIENKVYLKYDVANRKEFERFYDTLAKEDLQIKAMKDEIRELYMKAVLGVLVIPKIDFPKKFTSQLLFNGFQKFYKITLEKMAMRAVEFFEENGIRHPSDPEFQKTFLGVSLEKEKEMIARELGFDFSDEFYPQQMMTFCREKLEKSDTIFEKNMNELENFKTAFLIRIFEGKLIKDSYISELDNILLIGCMDESIENRVEQLVEKVDESVENKVETLQENIDKKNEGIILNSLVEKKEEDKLKEDEIFESVIEKRDSKRTEDLEIEIETEKQGKKED